MFYPPRLPQRRELAFASRMLPTIEINGSFYSLQRPEFYAAWHDETPDDFVFAVKGSRYITHMLKLQRACERRSPTSSPPGVLRLREQARARSSGSSRRSSAFDAERFDAFFALLPRDTEAALALARAARRAPRRAAPGSRSTATGRCATRWRSATRASSTRRFVALLRRHGIALVVADTAGRWPLLEDLTADFVYLRLHGDEELYASGYSDAALDRWAARIDAWRARRRRSPTRGSPRRARRAGARRATSTATSTTT